jgi:Phytanoyl-CoA dioxygenase (PhyH)
VRLRRYSDMVRIDEIDKIEGFIDDGVSGGAGTRRLIGRPWCSRLADQLTRDMRLSEALPTSARAVQCTLFAKSIASNWLVALHQDLSIPVAERVDNPEYQGWSEKEGELFVQPPVSILNDVVAVRLHLDDCDERNGALRVVPGSHRLGRLTTAEATGVRNAQGQVCVQVPRGGAMVMKPLLLHASSKALIHNRRRVLHFVFGPGTRQLRLALLPCRRRVVGAIWRDDGLPFPDFVRVKYQIMILYADEIGAISRKRLYP